MNHRRLFIFALFWIGWVTLLPFAHHHLVRTAHEVLHIESGKECAVQCVACHWATNGIAKIEPPLQPAWLCDSWQQPLFIPPLYHRQVVSVSDSRAPPQV